MLTRSGAAHRPKRFRTGLLNIRVPLLPRRVVTLIPALVVLVADGEPTRALVVSQVVLSFDIALPWSPSCT